MQTEDVELGLFAHPGEARGGEGTCPGVVLVHDVWGLSEHARDLTQRLAREGFGVLGIDLYRREEKVEITDPGAWMRGLSDPQVLEDIGAGVSFLRDRAPCRGRKVGVTGFCMGGSYALLAGCGVANVSAVAPFYGILSHEHGLLYAEEGLDPARKPRQPLDAVADLSCPLLAFYGDRDQFVPLSDVEELRRRLDASGQPTEVVVYPGAGHAFVNDTRPDAHRPDAARDAWTRMVAFFREHLA
jgi:carboxymethylenebutenolidase